MVHESLDGKVAVVGIMYMIGRPDSFLSSVSIIYIYIYQPLCNYLSLILSNHVFH
jgi:hypothetical protein